MVHRFSNKKNYPMPTIDIRKQTGGCQRRGRGEAGEKGEGIKRYKFPATRLGV